MFDDGQLNVPSGQRSSTGCDADVTLVYSADNPLVITVEVKLDDDRAREWILPRGLLAEGINAARESPAIGNHLRVWAEKRSGETAVFVEWAQERKAVVRIARADVVAFLSETYSIVP